jgi:formylglycine-generating enzyme required for sulfatase activity
MSPAAKVSPWVQSELRLALESHKTIFPFRLDGDVWLDVFRMNIFDIRGDILPDTKFYACLAEISQPGVPRDSSSLAPFIDTVALRPITPPTVTPKETDQTIVENHPAESSKKTTTKRALDDLNSRHENRHLLINLLGLAVLIFATMIALKPFLTPLFSPSPPSQTVMPTNRPTSTPSATPRQPETMMQGGAKMVLIPAGPFIMGSDKGRENEKPVRTVYLPAFYIDIYEVTNVLYRECVTAQTCQPPTDLNSYRHPNYYIDTAYDQYPVNNVDWDMAKTYCEWRGARLPSEAEWEKAARGSDGRTYPWGEQMPDYTYTNFNDGITTSVGSYEKGRSPYNIYDMAGNVWEWVDDWYDRYPGSNAIDTKFGQTRRVMRGGGLTSGDLRSSTRFSSARSYASNGVGFRCALPLPE